MSSMKSNRYIEKFHDPTVQILSDLKTLQDGFEEVRRVLSEAKQEDVSMPYPRESCEQYSPTSEHLHSSTQYLPMNSAPMESQTPYQTFNSNKPLQPMRTFKTWKTESAEYPLRIDRQQKKFETKDTSEPSQKPTIKLEMKTVVKNKNEDDDSNFTQKDPDENLKKDKTLRTFKTWRPDNTQYPVQIDRQENKFATKESPEQRQRRIVNLEMENVRKNYTEDPVSNLTQKDTAENLKKDITLRTFERWRPDNTQYSQINRQQKKIETKEDQMQRPTVKIDTENVKETCTEYQNSIFTEEDPGENLKNDKLPIEECTERESNKAEDYNKYPMSERILNTKSESLHTYECATRNPLPTKQTQVKSIPPNPYIPPTMQNLYPAQGYNTPKWPYYIRPSKLENPYALPHPGKLYLPSYQQNAHASPQREFTSHNSTPIPMQRPQYTADTEPYVHKPVYVLDPHQPTLYSQPPNELYAFTPPKPLPITHQKDYMLELLQHSEVELGKQSAEWESSTLETASSDEAAKVKSPQIEYLIDHVKHIGK